MSTREIRHYKVRELDDAFAVVEEWKAYGSTGPDPGRLVSESVIVRDVSREYAEMLAREFTKRDFDTRWPGDCNIFVVHCAIERVIDMWTGPNAEWAERTSHPIVY